MTLSASGCNAGGGARGWGESLRIGGGTERHETIQFREQASDFRLQGSSGISGPVVIATWAAPIKM